MPDVSGGGNPRIGMLARVRNRRGIVTAVEPFPAANQELHHLVGVEYLDDDGAPDDWLLWEREIGATLLEPTALPDPEISAPLVPEEFDAITRAARWSALTPFLDPDGGRGPLERLPLTSPTHGAIQVDDFQLVPLLFAMRMPRVSLLLADDVGLGKTIEAGLILMELIRRRRVRRILIAVPAALQLQWQEEMRDKFCLSFDIVNREKTHQLRKRLGMDANPWRSFSRIITSYHYLKQPDVLEQFLAVSKFADGTPRLPWDVLVVDEAHNLSPSAFGKDSDLSQMLGQLAPHFEHKLFLSATPHNGHTRCFSGLLEHLDPVRFSQTSQLTDAEKRRMESIVVRRLKDEISARTSPPRFCQCTPQELPLHLSDAETGLHEAFRAFRAKVHELIQLRRGEQAAGAFAAEVLGKRLLSSTISFAYSWQRCRVGMQQDEAAAAAEVKAAQAAVEEETGDDRETESRNAHAANIIGAWLQPFASELKCEAEAVDEALGQLALPGHGDRPELWRPSLDARFHALCDLVEQRLRSDEVWRDDERLIIFTEYKNTQDYLLRRLRELYAPDEMAAPGEDQKDGTVILSLFGGCSSDRREAIKRSFNDPSDPVRILVATDTGSEGQNLQETARYLLHFDIPWNPSRIQQRNGRLDRHGQARDVTVFHFTSEDEADLSFLSHVLKKVHTIRHDLGSTGEVFDAGFQKRLIEGQDALTVQTEMEVGLQAAAGRASVPTTDPAETGEDEARRLEALKAELDLEPATLQQTLDVALGLGFGRPRLKGPDANGHVRFEHPVPRAWADTVDDTVSIKIGKGPGALPALTFDPRHFVKLVNGRPVFRPEHGTALLHLAHPMFRRAIGELAQARFPGSNDGRLSARWAVRRATIPQGLDALLLLTIEEMGVNELRESLHHWVRTIQIPVLAGEIGEPLPHAPARDLQAPTAPPDPEDVVRAREVWLEVAGDVKALLRQHRKELTAQLEEVMAADLTRGRQDEQDRFQSRQGELSSLIQQQTMERLEREIAEMRQQREQQVLPIFTTDMSRLDSDIRAREEEVQRRRHHYQRLRELLERERVRVLEQVLPRRYSLRGEAQVFPVGLEIRLPEGGR